MKEVSEEGKSKLLTFLANIGIEVEKTEFPEIYYAKCKYPFVFTIRAKDSASLRKITGRYEFGYDDPHLQEFIRNTRIFNNKYDVPSMVFFYDRKNKSIRFGNPIMIQKEGRFWKDAAHFPKGIWYIDVGKLSPINDLMKHI